jgi:hypothetical protein
VGDSASDISTDNIIAQVTTGVPIISGDTATSVAENNATPVVIYIAHADLSSGRSVQFDLAPGDDQFFSIDPLTGEISFIGFADYETKSEYTFTVIATDNFGETSSQIVLMPVLNQDELAPVWRSKTEVSTLIGSAVLYTASADDSGDISVEPISYSLDPNSVDFSYLSIDAASGEVVFKPGVVLPEGKVDYVFTVIADDGVNPSIAQQVVVTLTDTITVTGSGVLSQGGIRVVDVDNGDGSYTLEFYVDSTVASLFPNGVQNYDFVFNYNADQFQPIVASDYATSFSLPTVNDEVAGKLVVGAIDLTALDLADGTPIGSLTVTPLVENGIEVSVTDVMVNTSDLSPTQIIYSEPAIVLGTADNDTFALLGGDTEITGGLGVDAFIVTETTGNQIYITDFMPGEDIIDMSSLLMGLGYNGISDVDLGLAVNGEAREYSQTSMDLLELIQANDFSFDNSFGMLVDTTNGKIVGFYDADSNADSVDMRTFEINIGDAVNDITLEDLTAGIGGFIA